MRHCIFETDLYMSVRILSLLNVIFTSWRIYMTDLFVTANLV